VIFIFTEKLEVYQHQRFEQIGLFHRANITELQNKTTRHYIKTFVMNFWT